MGGGGILPLERENSLANKSGDGYHSPHHPAQDAGSVSKMSESAGGRGRRKMRMMMSADPRVHIIYTRNPRTMRRLDRRAKEHIPTREFGNLVLNLFPGFFICGEVLQVSASLSHYQRRGK